MKTDLMKGPKPTLMFWCQACQTHHAVPVRYAGDDGDTGWTWNGDREHPTLTPSLLTRGTVPLTDAQADKVLAGERIEPAPLVCHLFLTDGMIHYLADSTHVLAGLQHPLEDLP